MDKKRVWLVALVVLSLLMASCAPAATPVPPTPTPVPPTPTPVPPTPTPEEVEAPEEEAFSATTEALNQVDSFWGYVSWKGWGGGFGEEAQEADFEIRGSRQNKPARADHWTWTDHKEGTSLEWIAIEAENNMWMREEGEEWQEMGMYSPDMLNMMSVFSYDFWAGLFFEGLPEEATFVGQETVNGIPCRHYRTTDISGWGWVGFTGSADFNVWVAVEGEYPVKSTGDASGTHEGESFDWHLITELSKVNQPVDISPPM